MKTIKKFRYYCDFCKKSGGSKYHIKKHEDHCTMNPNRKCGMCEFVDLTPKPMPELLALLPDIENFIVHDVEDEHYSSYDMPIEIADKILTDLRDATDNCPACIMAALRQKGIPIPIIPNFIYSKEVKEFWAEVNSSISMKESNYSY